MSFLNPLLLLGALGISLPILAHMLNRFEVKHTDWAAMRFLNRSVRVRSRQLRLRDIFLLILRCLALLLIVLALAGPFGASENRLLAGLGEERAGVVLAIDASFSMQHREGETTRFAQALEAARQVARSIRPGDPVSLVLLGSEHQVLLRNMTYDPVAFAEILDSQEATSTSLDLESVPHTLRTLAEELEAPQREVYLISDMLAHQWTPRAAWLQASLKDLAEVATVFVVPVEGGSENLAITGLELVSGVLRQDTTARYRATVRNYGTKPARNVRVTGLVNNIKLDSKMIPEIASGSAESVSIFLPFRSAGAVHIMAELDADALMADNTRRTVAVIRDDVSVLCVDGDEVGGASSKLIAAALQAYKGLDKQENMVVQSVSWIDLPGQDLEQFDVVVLANVPDITAEQAAAFEQYVREGNGLIWFGGDLVKADVWNERSKRADVSLLPAVIEGAIGTTDAMGLGRPLDPAMIVHPVSRSLETLPEDLLSEARFHRVLQVRPTPASTKVLALAGSDAPILLGHALGRGHVFMFTTTADSAWNNMAVTPVFPLLLSQMVTYLTAREFETPRTVGDFLALSYTNQPEANDAVFETPSGELITVPVRSHRNQFVALLDKAREPGFYLARVHVQAPGVPIAVNVDTYESAVTGLSQEQATALFAPTKARLVQADATLTDAISTSRTQRSFWRRVMMAGILFLVLEGLLAGFLARRRSA